MIDSVKIEERAVGRERAASSRRHTPAALIRSSRHADGQTAGGEGADAAWQQARENVDELQNSQIRIESSFAPCHPLAHRTSLMQSYDAMCRRERSQGRTMRPRFDAKNSNSRTRLEVTVGPLRPRLCVPHIINKDVPWLFREMMDTNSENNEVFECDRMHKAVTPQRTVDWSKRGQSPVD